MPHGYRDFKQKICKKIEHFPHWNQRMQKFEIVI